MAYTVSWYDRLQMNENVVVVDDLDVEVSHLVVTPPPKHPNCASASIPSKVHTTSGSYMYMPDWPRKHLALQLIWIIRNTCILDILTASCTTMTSKFSATLFLMLCALSSCCGDDNYDWDCSAEEKQEVVSTWNAVYGVGHGRRSALAEGVFLRYVPCPLRARR